jgi:hypothetical protein
VPREDGVEALVVHGPRVDRMQPDGVAEVAQLVERRGAEGRLEVVEDALRHQEVRRLCTALVLELRELEGGLEREVDVVAEKEVAATWLAVEARKAVAAGDCCVEQLAIVVEVEGAAHAAAFRNLPSGRLQSFGRAGGATTAT